MQVIRRKGSQAQERQTRACLVRINGDTAFHVESVGFASGRAVTGLGFSRDVRVQPEFHVVEGNAMAAFLDRPQAGQSLRLNPGPTSQVTASDGKVVIV